MKLSRFLVGVWLIITIVQLIAAARAETFEGEMRWRTRAIISGLIALTFMHEFRS
jgi:hypothetical protein